MPLPKEHLLFICNENRQRSPTAEIMLHQCPKYEAQSAGVYPTARRVVDQPLIDWSDRIFVMSEREGQATFLKEHFDLKGKEIIDLDVSDMYVRNSKELVQLLFQKLSVYLELESCVETNMDVID